MRYVGNIFCVFNQQRHVQFFISASKTTPSLEGETLHTGVYKKPTDSYTPMQYERTVVKTPNHRAIQHSSLWEDHMEITTLLNKIWIMTFSRGKNGRNY